MPIDARIPLGVEVPEAPSALEAYGRVMHLRQMRDLGREREMRIERERREEEMERARTRVFSESRNPDGSVNHRAALQRMWEVDPVYARQYSVQVDAMDKAARLEEDAARELEQQKRGEFAQMLGNIKDGMDLRNRVTRGVARGLLTPDEAVTWLRMPWNEETQHHIGQVRNEVLTQVQQDQREEAQRAAAIRAEAEKRAVRNQGLQEAEAERDRLRFEQELPRLKTERQIKDMQLYGVQPISPAQAADDARLAAQRAETERHNKAMEAAATARAARQERAATGEMTPAQRRVDLKAIETEENRLHKEITEIGEQLKSGKNLKGVGLTDEERARLDALGTLKMARRDELLERKVERGYTRAEDVMPGGRKAPSAAAPGGKALTQEKAIEYLRKAQGDKDKARSLARADGYTF